MNGRTITRAQMITLAGRMLAADIPANTFEYTCQVDCQRKRVRVMLDRQVVLDLSRGQLLARAKYLGAV